jgi:hypothetical protein
LLGEFNSPIEIFDATRFPHYSQITPVLAGAQFVFGGRYHTAVTALSMGTPVILSPGNTFKSEGLEPMLGIKCPVVDPADLQSVERETIALTQNLAARHAAIQTAIARVKAGHQVFGDLLFATFCRAPARAQASRAHLRELFPSRPVVHQFDALYRDENPARARRPSLATLMRLRILQALPSWQPSIRQTFQNFT